MLSLLAFVTRGALLGIKPIRRDAKHVIALDANAVEDRTDNGGGLPYRFHSDRMLVDCSVGSGFG
jgi:hypothetical protein